jgi:phospholipid/cholesterol/gamma-HCH transport system substrate-binding protein
MDSKINYTLVGVFVVILTTGLIMFAYWLGENGGQQQYDYYHVYIPESVAGLSTDAAVKYRGVNVGTVESIAINSKNTEEVELRLKIEQGTPIKQDTKAKLQSFGITGLTFIELIGSSQDSPLLEHAPNKISVIPSSPSTYAQIDESLRLFSEKSSLALDKFDKLLSEENIANFSAILTETKLLTTNLRGQMPGIKQVVDNGVIMEQRVTSAFVKVDKAAASVKKMADILTENYADTGHKIQEDVHHSLASFNQLSDELQLMAKDLQRTIESLKASPSDLLFKHSSPRPGPGEDGYNAKKK